MRGEFKFPRPTVRVGDCLCFIQAKRNGSPRRDRPSSLDITTHRRVSYEGEKWPAHRLSYHLNVSPIPKGPGQLKEGLVLHKCDNGWCINPDHLYLGNSSQNAKDNAERNAEWRCKRAEIQKQKGFPEVSAEGRARMAKSNSERMKRLWAENPEEARRQRGI